MYGVVVRRVVFCLELDFFGSFLNMYLPIEIVDVPGYHVAHVYQG